MSDKVEYHCEECHTDYEVPIEEQPVCPECGFGPSSCSHPLEWRNIQSVYSFNEGRAIEKEICQKCHSVI